MGKVIPVGSPVNDVERHAIAFLRDNLPASYLVFHNIELGESNRAPYEFDLIVLGEHAVYAIEVKGYWGRVTGNKRDWYVRGKHRRSPLPMAFQKARVLSSHLRRQKKKIGPVWVEALVFLANTKVDPAFDKPIRGHVHACDTIVSALTDETALHRPHWDIRPAAKVAAKLRQILLGGRPSRGRTHVGPYRLLNQISQTDSFWDFEAVNEALIDLNGGRDGGRETPSIHLRLYPVDPYQDEASIRRHSQHGVWEASMLRWLGHHPGLVKAGDPFFPEDETIAVALPFEHAPGVTLTSYLDSEGALSEAQIRYRFGLAIEALGLAHSRGVVHRRITPHAFVCPSEGTFLLADFAFSSSGNSDLSQQRDEHTLHPRYSAPEVIEGATATTSSDVYSLGVVLAQALFGQQPTEVLIAGLGKRGAFGGLLLGMMSADPDDRPADGHAVLEAMRSAAPDAADPLDGVAIVATGQLLLEPGTRLNGAYQIEQRLGPPRTNTTYRALHLVSNSVRKIRLVRSDRDGLAMLRTAFAACYDLRHAALVRINELDEVRTPEFPNTAASAQPPMYLIDSEHVVGSSAQALIAAGGIGEDRSLKVMQQLLALLSYLHGRRVAHGGLSSETVFLDDDDRVRVVRLPNWFPSELFGPPPLSYLDPRRVGGFELDTAAVCITTWELATGQHPLGSEIVLAGAKLSPSVLRKLSSKSTSPFVELLAPLLRAVVNGSSLPSASELLREM